MNDEKSRKIIKALLLTIYSDVVFAALLTIVLAVIFIVAVDRHAETYDCYKNLGSFVVTPCEYHQYVGEILFGFVIGFFCACLFFFRFKLHSYFSFFLFVLDCEFVCVSFWQI